MEEQNMSSITTIHLLGFHMHHSIRLFISFLVLIIYCVTICGNLLIITLVSYSKSLHSPMYFFLSQLSVADILIITDIFPSMLDAVLTKETVLSFSDCITQLYFFGLSEALECLLLTAMCYDRHLAICKPLHYSLAMSVQVCWLLITTCWITSILIILVFTLLISKLKFCSLDIVDHFFCDLDPILQPSCYDTKIFRLEVTLINVILTVTPFFIIIVSYVYIIFTIFKIPSITGRQKVFSTCSSHLTVVCLFYGTLISVYFIPRKELSGNYKYLSLMYTVGTPLLNPIIYSLRNEDLKKAISKMINHGRHLLQ